MNFDDDSLAAADMKAMSLRQEAADKIDQFVESSGGREKMFYLNDDGQTFVNVDILYGMALAMSFDGMQSVMRGDLASGAVYAHASTLVNVLAIRAEGKEPNVHEHLIP